MKNKVPIKEAEKDLEYIQIRMKELLELLSQEGKYHDPVDITLPSLSEFCSTSSSSATVKTKFSNMEFKKNEASSSEMKTATKRSAAMRNTSDNNEMGALEGISDNEEEKPALKKMDK